VVGLVIVSHSAKLAEGVAELAREMGGPEVIIETAGGTSLPDAPLGTDAMLVVEAIQRAASPSGVLVLMDLGSAVLSTEMALEMLPEEVRSGVALCSAPIVEGAVAAASAARAELDIAAVAEEARGGLRPKIEHIGDAAAEPPGQVEASGRDPADTESVDLEVKNRLGLHARPAARFVGLSSGFDADISVRNLTTESAPAPAKSLNAVASLGVRQGHRIRVSARGPEAANALVAIAELAASGFGDEDEEERGSGPIPTRDVAGATFVALPASPGIGRGPARLVRLPPPEPPARGGQPARELGLLLDAVEAVEKDLEGLRASVAERHGDDIAAIFDAQAMFLRDEALLGPAREAISEENVSAGSAYLTAARSAANRFSGLDDPYLAARGEDVVEIGERVAARASGLAWGMDAPVAGVMVTERLPAGVAAQLDADTVAGVLAGAGRAETHSSIILRASGIPAVVGAGERLREIEESTEILLDGGTGAVFLEPASRAVNSDRTATGYSP
jgi:multiphosphoryl transfer protein